MKEEFEKALLKATKRNDGSLRFKVVDQKAKPIISLWLISQDIVEMIACLDRMVKVQKIKEIDKLIPTSLWEKMIVSYGKIFSNSNSGFSKIEAKHYFTSARSVDIHKKLIDIRNSYLAHRGYNEYEYSIMVMDLVEKSGKNSFEFSFPSLKQIGHYNKNHKSILRHLKMLRKQVEKNLNGKIKKLQNFILDEIGVKS
jgi:hypothetical protein